MMKRISETPWLTYLLISVVLLNTIFLVVLGCYYFSNKKASIAYVDAIELMRNYHGMARVKNQLDEDSKVWRMNLDTLKQEADSEIREYERKKPKLSSVERSSWERTITEKKQKYFEYKDIVENQYRKKEKDLLDKMLETLNEKIKVYAKENSYEFILSSGSQGNIAYASDNLNLTKTLIEVLNKEYDKAISK